MARSPSRSMSPTTASPRPWSRPVTTSSHPLAARVRAVAAPIPLVEPVTRTVPGGAVEVMGPISLAARWECQVTSSLVTP
jgi:hypothetical protein